jgi:ABC-type branched-subunit amino acid transport system substrate-binding protein
MESKPHLSPREIRLLFTYGLVAAGVVALYLLLAWVRAGAPTEFASAYQAEIAVLVPVTGEGAPTGRNISYLVDQSKNYFASELGLDKWKLTVLVYDTGNTASSAAWAATQAARNPNTIAIVGPLDARQVVAVQNTVRGKNLPVITVSSTTPSLSVSSSRGVYRIPGTDDLQGPAIVRFLRWKRYADIFLIAEAGDYTGKVLATFQEAANTQLKVVGNAEIKPESIMFDANQVANSNASAIVYLGGSKGLGLIIQGLQQANQHIPIVGIDSINDPVLAPALANGQELFFTSPIFMDTNNQGPYRDLPFDKFPGPYSLQSVQATWLIMEALSSTSDGFGRETVWENLSDSSIRGAGGEKLAWINGQLTPVSIYVYEGSPKESEWFHNPVFVSHP